MGVLYKLHRAVSPQSEQESRAEGCVDHLGPGRKQCDANGNQDTKKQARVQNLSQPARTPAGPGEHAARERLRSPGRSVDPTFASPRQAPKAGRGWPFSMQGSSFPA